MKGSPITVKHAYELADWAARVACPALLGHDDGRRKCFPEHAERLRNLFPVRDQASADTAGKVLNKEILPKIVDFRDGMPTVPLRATYWLCMAAVAIEKGFMLPADYGSEGIKDLLEYMRIPVKL